MMNPESKPPVTIEDLLRLKRAERPKAAFWSDFDRELREKQLAALVAKRPWWKGLPTVLRGLARYHLPLGASAVLAVTFLSIRDYHPSLSTPNAGSVPAYEGAPRGVAPAAQAPADPLVGNEHDVAAPAPVVAAATPAPEALRSEANRPGELSRMVPMLPADDSASQASLAPSARSIAENRAVAEAMLGTTSTGFETRALPVRITPPEPLAQMSNPSEVRRSRFAMVFAAASFNASPAPTARVARRLSDEQLYDTIHRFGASGNSVSFRF